MSKTRLSLVEILSSAFESEELKTKCCESSKKALHARHSSKRIFDDFPCMLFEGDVVSLCDKFKKILNEAKPEEFEEGHFKLTLKTDMDAVCAWNKEIANFACMDMLDSNGHLKKELMKLLTWEHDLSQIQVCDVVCAYVSSIHQEIINRLTSELFAHESSIKAIDDLQGKQYAIWAIDVLKESKLIFDNLALKNIDWSRFITILRLPFDKPEVGIGLGVGAVALTLLGVGITLFQKFNGASASPVSQSDLTNIFKGPGQ